MPLDGERVSPYVDEHGNIRVKPTVYDEAGMIVPDPTWVQHLKDVRAGKFETSIPPDRISPGAFGGKSKTVPLVIYEQDGTRKVVGKATITPDDTGFHISGAVTDPEMKKLVEANVSGFGAIANPKFEKGD